MVITIKSDFIFDDGQNKGRIIQIHDNWYQVEVKRSTGNDPWVGGLSGTREWLGLTDDELSYVIDKRKK